MPVVTTEIIICPMKEEDLDQVLEIEGNSFPHPWLRQHFIDELNSPHASPLSAFDVSGRLVGYICPMQLLDEGHILDVAVDPALRGAGIGRLLVQQVLQDCRFGGASFVSLEVRESNFSAIGLYKKMGFAEVGKRKNYYENGEDALMMEYVFTTLIKSLPADKKGST
jgi:ribosomal-protein-alanine N-acetyltransferase